MLGNQKFFQWCLHTHRNVCECVCKARSRDFSYFFTYIYMLLRQIYRYGYSRRIIKSKRVYE